MALPGVGGLVLVAHRHAPEVAWDRTVARGGEARASPQEPDAF
jgi:hypothetical protein